MGQTLQRTVEHGCSLCGDSGRIWASADGYCAVSVRCKCGQSCHETSTLSVFVVEMTIAAGVTVLAFSAVLLLT